MIRAWAGLDFIRAKNNRTGVTGVSASMWANDTAGVDTSSTLMN